MSRPQNPACRLKIPVYCFLIIGLLLTACLSPSGGVPQGVDDRPLTVTPTVDGGPATVTPTPAEAPLTLAELGIPAEQENFFSGVEGHIKREVIDGEKVYTTTILYHNGEQKEVKYIIEPGTFDAHTEIHDYLTQPLAVKAYRLDENGRRTEVIIFWQGPERGFREAIDLSGAYDPELKQINRHPYVHIVHADRPINSIDGLPKDDERLTLLQSVRLEQAKAIQALRAIYDKIQKGETITIEDVGNSIFVRELRQKIEKGETITEKDLHIVFSNKAVGYWLKAGGLSLYFEMLEDGSKIVVLKSKINDLRPNYDDAGMKFFPLFFHTVDEEGKRHDKFIIFTLDADDIQRYEEALKSSDPLPNLNLQGKS